METDRGGRVVSGGSGTAVQIFRWGTLVMVAAVLIQAFLGGRGFFVDQDILTVHGRIGDLLLLVTIAHVVVGVVAYRQRQLWVVPPAVSVLLVVLVFIQLSLGYESEDSRTAAAWHLPNGVLIFGVTVMNAFLAGAVPWAVGPPGRLR